ncbi:MAG TPA: DUF898 family protein [Geobacteraceae bacterium]
MRKVAITCPCCGFSKEVDPEAIPAGAARVTCPRCKQGFALQESMPPPGEPPRDMPPQPPETCIPPAFPAASRPRSARTLDFAFTGTASEYFGIWIVNTLLKVVTLGIYSAWAKVRKRRYFYGNTLLDDVPFDYLADPFALFKGWLIGAGLFIVYTLGSRLHPALGSLFALLFFAGMPWLIVRSQVYNARNSSHRNIRFNFRANYHDAYLVFCGFVLLTPFTLGLLFPYVVYRQKKFLVENSAYGQTPFSFEGNAREFYLLFAKAAAGFVAAVLLLFLATALLSTPFAGFLTALSHGVKPDKESARMAAVAAFVFFILFMALFYLFGSVYLRTALANLTWNATRLGGERFQSTLRSRDMAWLYLSNAVAIPLSLGLLTPWASLRLTRYRLARLSIRTTGELEQIVAAPLEEVGPAGEEIGDILGIDVAL